MQSTESDSAWCEILAYTTRCDENLSNIVQGDGMNLFDYCKIKRSRRQREIAFLRLLFAVASLIEQDDELADVLAAF